MKAFTNALKEQVAMYIKNGADISTLIADVDLKDANLSGAKIKYIAVVDRNISGCDFSKAIIGSTENTSPVSIIRCNLTNCNFEGTQFISRTWMRSCNAQNCNFKNADVHLVSYEHTDFLGSTFCGAIITIGTREGYGCRFPITMFDDLCKDWKLKLTAEYID